MESLIKHLATAPDSHLDAYAVAKIRKWQNPPTAIEVLEVLDDCVHGSLCSGAVLRVLEIILDARMTAELTTYEDLIKRAIWRNRA